MAQTTAQQVLRGRIGAAIARSRHEPRALTAAGREAFLARFERMVREEYPDLSDAEVHRRAGELKKAHMLRLALASSIARAKKKAASHDARLTARRRDVHGVTPAEAE